MHSKAYDTEKDRLLLQAAEERLRWYFTMIAADLQPSRRAARKFVSLQSAQEEIIKLRQQLRISEGINIDHVAYNILLEERCCALEQENAALKRTISRMSVPSGMNCMVDVVRRAGA